MITDSPQLWTDEERWQVLMENVKDFGIFMLDAEGRIATWNAGAERLLGYTSDEIVGEPFATIFSADDVDQKQPEFEIREARDKGRCEDERWHVRKDGSRFWASGVLTPLWTDRGTLRGYAKVVRDITERKMSEVAAGDANRRKDEFLAILSHEFRNPLSAIMNAAQLLKLESASAETVDQATNIIQRQGETLIRIVDDLLDITRINKGKFQLVRERVDLREIVASAVESATPAIESRRHQVEYSPPAKSIWLEGDAHRLRQIFANLLVNAAKYTDSGGTITVAVKMEGSQVSVRVKDNGAGIVSEMLPRIFELFVQADSSSERSGGGLGIGLALVKRLVEMHGGRVEAFSEGVGKGSEFQVHLPTLDWGGSDGEPRNGEPMIATSDGSSILVVDDDADGADTLALLLEKIGHQVTVARSGPEALRVADQLRPDVVILDIGLPGMDGFQVAQMIRGRNELASVRLIALTGYGQGEDREKSKLAGFDAHLVKPVELTTLLEILKAGAAL
jgi:PAS domain S-box-containing protein